MVSFQKVCGKYGLRKNSTCISVGFSHGFCYIKNVDLLVPYFELFEAPFNPYNLQYYHIELTLFLSA